jgi:pyruvate dehydrogenase E1 component beta subunit
MFGQNIAAGSCIGGLTRGLKSGEGHLVVNTPNCENTLVGTGFGLMLNGVSAIFFMKQQDFLLLGIDQLVNTYNLIRRRKLNSSFTIVSVVVDSGYEGPQSALNNFSDFCSIARVPGYTITNKHDAARIIDAHLTAPGFRIIGVSQRLFRTELLEIEGLVTQDDTEGIFQYAEGEDATIACFNFSFPQGLALWKEMKQRGLTASLFSVNAMLPIDWEPILTSVRRTRRLAVLDDSKSVNRSCHHLAIAVAQKCPTERVLLVTRTPSDEGIRPNADQFSIDHEGIIGQLGFGHDTPLAPISIARF